MNPMHPASAREHAWRAMAAMFLDTETRPEIPHTALACVEAGLSIREARRAWCEEVSPAVGANLWNPVGEWAGWDPDWLIDRIRRNRARRFGVLRAK